MSPAPLRSRQRTDGIPKSFKLLGHTITVRVVPPSKWRHGKGCVGIYQPDKYRIDILAVQPESHRQQVFCHEFSHALLILAGRDDLSSDEQLVDQLGHLLQQALGGPNGRQLMREFGSNLVVIVCLFAACKRVCSSWGFMKHRLCRK